MLVVTGVLLAMGLLLAPACLWAQSGAVLEVGKFSTSQVGQAAPDGWKPLTFKKIPKHTSYEVVKDGGVTIVKAVSEASASGLIKPVVIDPKEYPIVRWRWKIDNVLQHSDVALKEGDDFPARLYITFAYDPDKVGFGKKLKFKAGQALFGDIPIAALNYIWETKTPVGTIVENAYTNFTQMIVVESGPQKVGMWIDEERNIYEDYKTRVRGGAADDQRRRDHERYGQYQGRGHGLLRRHCLSEIGEVVGSMTLCRVVAHNPGLALRKRAHPPIPPTRGTIVGGSGTSNAKLCGD